MAILFSGDFHANAVNEMEIISKDFLLNQYGREIFDSIKYHIILGDGGFNWPGNQRGDHKNFRALSQRPFPVLCVTGNHEPVLGMGKLRETDIGLGETVYLIQTEPFIAYLKRGKIYNIDGFRTLVLGGALSIDKNIRVPGTSWWEKEYWTDKEKKDLINLVKTENTFDFVLSHTGPNRINKSLVEGEYVNYSLKFKDEVALLNDVIDLKITCTQWWCGHWHKDDYLYDEKIKRGYQYLYRTTKVVEKTGDGITRY